MKTITIPRSLESLVQYLNGLQARVSLESLSRHLAELNVTLDDLRPYMHFGESCYQRNLICEGQWYELLCICWRNGQKSLIHNHAGSTCGLRLVAGSAIETTFRERPDGQVEPASNRKFRPGQVCCTQDSDIHQVNNVSANQGDLITLHIYSPPLGNMQTWEYNSPAND